MRQGIQKMEKANLASLAYLDNVIYNDGELAFFDNIDGSRISDYTVQLEVFTIALVTEGRATLLFNGERYEAKRNDLLICPPHSVIGSGPKSGDFQGHCLCVSSSYIQRILPLAENFWDMKFLLENNPACHLQPGEAKVLCQYYDLLCSKAQYSSAREKKVIDTIVQALIYDMRNVLGRVMEHSPRPFTSREVLFKRFLDLIESVYPRPRSVAYYADRLHVTPKYFSMVCKQVGGQKAGDIIAQYVLRDIAYLMNHTRKSIKEIACELGFSNLSFFGKYVKKHFGMSPKAYREQALRKAQ